MYIDFNVKQSQTNHFVSLTFHCAIILVTIAEISRTKKVSPALIVIDFISCLLAKIR